MFWWEDLLIQVYGFCQRFYNWKEWKTFFFIAKTAKPHVRKALTSRNLLLIGGLTREPDVVSCQWLTKFSVKIWHNWHVHLFLRSLLANMEAPPFASELNKFISVLIAIIWTAEATKCLQNNTGVNKKPDFLIMIWMMKTPKKATSTNCRSHSVRLHNRKIKA